MDELSIAPHPAAPTSATGPIDRIAYSIAEAAVLLGVSRVTIWRWIRDGRLSVTRLGHRTTRIRGDDLERLLLERVTAQAGSAAARSWVSRTLEAGGADGNGTHDGDGLRATAHIVQFYETDAFLLDAVAAFIGPPLTEGEAGIVIATPAHRAGLAERLQAAGVDIDATCAAGRYLDLDAAEALDRFMVDGMPDADRFAQVIGGVIAQGAAAGRGVRAFGEMVALLAAEGNHVGALDLEALWNGLQQTHDFSLLCAYPMAGLDGAGHAALLDGVCAEHTRVFPTESYTALPTPDERLRAIALLQQKARWLEAEVRERERAEAELRQREEVQQRLAAIVESSEDAIIGKTLDAVITSWNAAGERIYGYSAEDAVGQSIAMLVPSDRPDELPAIMARLRRGERIANYETERVRKDGTRLIVSLTISPIRDAAGTLVGASTIARDITDRKRADAALRESEARFRLLADTVPSIVWTAAPDGIITYASEQWFRYCGVTPEQNARNWPELVLHPDDQERCVEQWTRTLREGTDYEIEVRNRRHDGEYRWFLTRAVPVRDAAGRITAWFGTSTDIDDSKQAEAALREQADVHVALNAALREAAQARDQALAEAQAALRVRDDFLGTISHDLRTPLSSVKGLSQLLLRQAGRTPTLESARVTTVLTNIDAATNKMAAMIDELLDLARLHAGEALELDRRPTDLVALVRETAAEFQRSAPEHRLVVEACGATLTGSWDTTRIDRVAANLLSNAIKYSPDGGTITVTLAQEATDDGVWATLIVQDNGLGIPAADLPHIFDRFHRGANVTGQIRGTGIGLAGCKQIVELHDGAIAVASEEGAGTTVTVRLPCEASPHGSVSQP